MPRYTVSITTTSGPSGSSLSRQESPLAALPDDSTGCLLELTKAQGPWLQPGDVVELEAERLGVLRNRVAAT